MLPFSALPMDLFACAVIHMELASEGIRTLYFFSWFSFLLICRGSVCGVSSALSATPVRNVKEISMFFVFFYTDFFSLCTFNALRLCNILLRHRCSWLLFDEFFAVLKQCCHIN